LLSRPWHLGSDWETVTSFTAGFVHFGRLATTVANVIPMRILFSRRQQSLHLQRLLLVMILLSVKALRGQQSLQRQRLLLVMLLFTVKALRGSKLYRSELQMIGIRCINFGRCQICLTLSYLRILMCGCNGALRPVDWYACESQGCQLYFVDL